MFVYSGSVRGGGGYVSDMGLGAIGWRIKYKSKYRPKNKNEIQKVNFRYD